MMLGERAKKRLRPFSHDILNPLVRRWAGGRCCPFALLLHEGRWSGRLYATPILVRAFPPSADGPLAYVIALTYGPVTDWYRNLVATGGGAVRWQGQRVRVGPPELIARDEALPAFHPVERALIRLLGIEQFVCVPVLSWPSPRV